MGGGGRTVVHVKYKIFSIFTHIHSADLFTQYAFVSISFPPHSHCFYIQKALLHFFLML